MLLAVSSSGYLYTVNLHYNDKVEYEGAVIEGKQGRPKGQSDLKELQRFNRPEFDSVAVGGMANSYETEFIRPGCIEQAAAQTPKGKRGLRKGGSEGRFV
ncbi:unnamed protein product [Hymenolepis diminuta]|uniref:Uncharacterized protein n=1 Tax=Hymenolepis diminuta TaxID=6216 RepID=A0A564XYZ5_HYMDI|nr:unnamed protein product [Hymenolepis diminuta]